MHWAVPTYSSLALALQFYNCYESHHLLWFGKLWDLRRNEMFAKYLVSNFAVGRAFAQNMMWLFRRLLAESASINIRDSHVFQVIPEGIITGVEASY